MSRLRSAHRRNKHNKLALYSSKKSARRQSFSLKKINWNFFRVQFVAILFCFIWGGLWFRAGYIQLWEGTALAQKAKRQYMTLETITTPRRSIIDRNGRTLAKSVECYSIYANPSDIEDIPNTASHLSKFLGKPVEHFINILDKPRRFVWVSRHIDDATATAVKEANIPGVMLIHEYERVYPYKHVAGQLLGFVGIDGKGLEGIEFSFNDYLSSNPTKQLVLRDASGRKFYVTNERGIVEHSGELQLTIDLTIQSITENAIAQMVEQVGAKWGGVLVVDVKEGDILAWSQYPFFNPNAYQQYKPGEYRNRIALDAFEPGSTLKPFLVAAALQEGIVTKDTLFNCENGIWKVKNSIIRDDGRGYGELSVSKILSHSSNIGCGKISLELGSQRFYHYLSKVGFGQPIGLSIVEGKGILRRPREWSELDLISTAFGQSISSTTLQLTQGFLTIANYGEYKSLRLIKNSVSKDCNGNRIFSEKISQELLEMMCNVVESGTGKKAAISGISIAGKTGTSQKIDKTGKYGQERIASFVGVFPAEEPKYLVLIVIDEPSTKKYGGTIAAPVFRSIATRMIANDSSILMVQRNVTDQSSLEVQQVIGDKKYQQAKGISNTLNKIVKSASNSFEVRKKIVQEEPIQMNTTLSVPDVIGKSIRKAVEIFAGQGLVPEVKGSGIVVVKQEPEAGTHLNRQNLLDKKCILWLSER